MPTTVPDLAAQVKNSELSPASTAALADFEMAGMVYYAHTHDLRGSINGI